MSKKINLLMDSEPKVFSKFLINELKKKKINTKLYENQIFDHNKILNIYDSDYIVYFTQINNVFLELKRTLELSSINLKKIDNEIKNLAKTFSEYSLKNKKIFFILWPLDVSDKFLGGINFKDKGKNWIINYINLNVSKSLSKLNNVHLLDPNYLILYKQKKIEIFDSKLKYLIGCEYSHQYIEFLAKTIAINIREDEKLKKIKLIILDLDNTLWGGLAGEINYDEIKVGPNSIEGQVYYDFQKRLKFIRSSGIILAISSKNNFKNVEKIFKKNKYMLLTLKDFSSINVNWDRKDENIKKILNELNLKPEHTLFIDDNPFEREIVKKNISKINIFEFPENLLELNNKFNNYSGLDKNFISSTDRKRTQLYLQENKRELTKKLYKNESKWLKNLNIKINISKLQNFDRAEEMFNRTNQFNTSFNKLDKSQILKFSKLKNHLFFQVSMKDKFGDYGIISIVHIIAGKNNFQIIDFLMSCRVFKRNVEIAILIFLNNLKIFKNKIGYIDILRKEKNEYVQELFDNSNFLVKDGVKRFGISDKINNEKYNKYGISLI